MMLLAPRTAQHIHGGIRIAGFRHKPETIMANELIMDETVCEVRSVKTELQVPIILQHVI